MDDPLPSAKITRRLRFSPVWLIPVLAIILSATLLGNLWFDRKPFIDVGFADGEGLREGITPLKYRGVNIGLIKDLTLSDDRRKVITRIDVDHSAIGLAREGSQFWIVRPEVGIAGIQGLNTLISGPFIQIHPGEGPPQQKFTGQAKPPSIDEISGGLLVQLRAARLGSLKPGAPVYYREVEVGEVMATVLAEDASHVQVRVHIQQGYAPLVRQNSVFWNATGIDLKAGLFGMELRSESLAAILSGGVAFATPEKYGPVVTAGNEFTLNDKPRDEWLAWSPVIRLKGQPGDRKTTTAEQAKPPGSKGEKPRGSALAKDPDKGK